MRLQRADFRLLEEADFEHIDPRDLRSAEWAVGAGMRKLVECAMLGFQHHVEKYDGMYLIFFKQSWYQYILVLQSSRYIHEDTQMYLGAVAERDMDEAQLAQCLSHVHFPVVTGDFAIKESRRLFETKGIHGIKWFTPHSSPHPSLRGKKIAGFLYSRFLNQRGVGFLTDEHTGCRKTMGGCRQKSGCSAYLRLTG